MKKRILSMILCACLVLGLCPMLNFAPLTEAHAAETPTVYEFYCTQDAIYTSDGFYSFSGSYKNASLTYNGTLYPKGIKMESQKPLTFTTEITGKLIVVFGNTSASKKVTIDGSDYTIGTPTDSVYVMTIKDLTVGNHTIEKANSSGTDVFIYYVSFTPDSSSSGGEGGGTTDPTTTSPNPDCEHSYSVSYQWADDYSACTAIRTCSNCDAVDTANATVEITNTATCTAAGTKTWTATFTETWATGATYSEDSAALGHNWENKDGVCSVCTAECEHKNDEGNSAWENGTCSVCGLVCAHESLDANNVCTVCGVDTSCDHSYTSEETKTPNCSQKGEMTYTCSKCGDTYTEETATNPDVHPWGDVVPVVNPTCITVGSGTRTCALCDTTEEDVVIPAGHSYVGGKCSVETCGASENSTYIVDFTEREDKEKQTVDLQHVFFKITGKPKLTKDNKNPVIYGYYGDRVMTAYLKMNETDGFSFSCTGDEEGGVVIMVFATTTTDPTVITMTASADGATTTTLDITLPYDGIFAFTVKPGVTYTIEKKTTENPLFYLEYVPGATLLSSDTGDTGTEGGDTGNEGGDTGNDDETTVPDTEIEVFSAQIGTTSYRTLAEAVAAVQANETILLLHNNTETVTVGANLSLNQKITIDKNGYSVSENGVQPAEGCKITTDGDEIIITRVCPVGEHTDDDDNNVCDKCESELSGGEETDPYEGVVAWIDSTNSEAKEIDEGEETFKTVAEALAKVQAGQIVRMYADHDEGDVYLTVRGGVTLDLNGFQLTAGGLSAFNGNNVIDSSENTTGLLVVDKANLILPQRNEELPVWNESNGYFFMTPNTANDVKQFFVDDYTEGLFKIKFKPGMGYVNGDSSTGTAVRTEYLLDGGENNGLTLVVRITCTGTNGDNVQSFVYSDTVFAKGFADGESLTLGITSVGSAAEVYINVVFISETGVEFVGETLTWTAPAETVE